MKENSYPVYRPDQDGRRKLMPDDIAKMKELHAMRVPHKGPKGIAAMFGVNPTTVRWHVDSEYRERKTLRKVEKCNIERRNGGEEYLLRRKEIRKKCYEKKKSVSKDELLAFKRESVKPFKAKYTYSVINGKRVYRKKDGSPMRMYRKIESVAN